MIRFWTARQFPPKKSRISPKISKSLILALCFCKWELWLFLHLYSTPKARELPRIKRLVRDRQDNTIWSTRDQGDKALALVYTEAACWQISSLHHSLVICWILQRSVSCNEINMLLSKTVTDNELHGICLGSNATVKRNSYESADLEMFWTGCDASGERSDHKSQKVKPTLFLHTSFLMFQSIHSHPSHVCS